MAAKKRWSRDQKRALKKAKRTPLPRGAPALLPFPTPFATLTQRGIRTALPSCTIYRRKKCPRVLREFVEPCSPLARR